MDRRTARIKKLCKLIGEIDKLGIKGLVVPFEIIMEMGASLMLLNPPEYSNLTKAFGEQGVFMGIRIWDFGDLKKKFGPKPDFKVKTKKGAVELYRTENAETGFRKFESGEGYGLKVGQTLNSGLKFYVEIYYNNEFIDGNDMFKTRNAAIEAGSYIIKLHKERKLIECYKE